MEVYVVEMVDASSFCKVEVPRERNKERGKTYKCIRATKVRLNIILPLDSTFCHCAHPTHS